MNKPLYVSYALMISLVIALPGSYILGHRQGVREGIYEGKIIQVQRDSEWVESGWRAAKAAMNDCLSTISQNGDVNVAGSAENVSVGNKSNNTCIKKTLKSGKVITTDGPRYSY